MRGKQRSRPPAGTRSWCRPSRRGCSPRPAPRAGRAALGPGLGTGDGCVSGDSLAAGDSKGLGTSKGAPAPHLAPLRRPLQGVLPAPVQPSSARIVLYKGVAFPYRAARGRVPPFPSDFSVVSSCSCQAGILLGFPLARLSSCCVRGGGSTGATAARAQPVGITAKGEGFFLSPSVPQGVRAGV